MSAGPRILVVRRDNIGDLVCTTPLIAALRARFPEAWIGVLANTYNAPILAAHPDIDAVFLYRKLKHGGIGTLGLAAERIRLARELRTKRFEYVFLAKTLFEPREFYTARLLSPTHIVGYAPMRSAPPRALDHAVPETGAAGMHEVERVFRLARAIGIEGPPPPLRLAVDAGVFAAVQNALANRMLARPVVGVHLSARKPSQRWPAERFVALMRALHERYRASFVLFWAPGPAAHPQHPGDDEKAAAVLQGTRGLPVLDWPTRELRALVAGLAACDRVVCSDGGAMHIAAALGKPIVCFVGNSDATRWRPWGVPHRLLQRASREVTEITVADALAACCELAAATTEARAGSG
jgi:ADP-heptose:LPS heptosyltransferase